MIEFSNVSKKYKSGTHALKRVNFKVEEGEFVFIVGSSGAGKSTMMKLLMGEEKPTAGTVFVNGYNVNRMRRWHVPKLRRSLGIVFQDFRLIPTMTAYENVAFALRVTNIPAKEIRPRVTYVLRLLGLAGKAKSYPEQLSGGEQQRVALARALVNNPPIIVADEPTGNIDPELAFEILDLLCQINEQCGTTILMVTHEHELVSYFDKRTVAIEDGTIVADSHADRNASGLFTGATMAKYGEHYDGKEKANEFVGRTKHIDRGPESQTGIYSFVLSDDEDILGRKE